MRGALLIVMACGAGCGGNGIGTGRLAFSDPSGDLVVLDLATDERMTIETPGAPGALAVSLDGAALAFAVEPELFARKVHVADLETGAVREVRPETGEQVPFFRWGSGRLMTYRASAGGVSRQLLVSDGATTARALGAYETSAPTFSPVEPLIAYSDCAEPAVQFECGHRLVVETAAGDPTVLATSPDLRVVSFTPDGSEVVALEDVDGVMHLTVHAIDGSGTPRDLGLADDVPYSDAPISPDGAEVLAIRDGQLIALALDGGGARPIAPEPPWFAAFIAPGEVLYSTETNTSPPDDDTPEYVYSLHVSRAGETLALITDELQCWGLSVSAGLVGWTCGDAVLVVSLADGTLVRRIEGGGLIAGFDADDAGLVVATWATTGGYELVHVDLDGDTVPLGTAMYQDTADGLVQWPPYVYLP